MTKYYRREREACSEFRAFHGYRRLPSGDLAYFDHPNGNEGAESREEFCEWLSEAVEIRPAEWNNVVRETAKRLHDHALGVLAPDEVDT